MRVYAYCISSARIAVQDALGVMPYTSTPYDVNTIDLKKAEGCGFLYFRLHGLPNIPTSWFGEGERHEHVEALSARNLDGVDLTGAVVLLANCYGSDSPLVAEFYKAGAQAVVAGPGPNMAGARRVIGTDKLAQFFLYGLRRGWTVDRALQFAKVRLQLTRWRRADRDALEFQIMED